MSWIAPPIQRLKSVGRSTRLTYRLLVRVLPLVLIIATGQCASYCRADEVILKYPDGKAEQRRRGTITDLKGNTLTLQTTTGRISEFPIDRIEKLEASWAETHLAADAEFEKRQFQAALAKYRSAFNVEQRGWVKRRILERVIWCYRNSGRPAEACKMFARLVAEDPDTPYFDAIPLMWQLKQCPADVRKLVGNWILSGEEPAKQLIAASWLLVSRRTEAIATLRNLGKSSSERIRSLAIMQLWRTELLTLEESRLSWWSNQLARVPISLRSGPYFLLGKSFARLDQPDDAVLAYLRIDSLYPDDVLLAQQALIEAGEILRANGRSREAVRVYQQALQLGDSTRNGQVAQNVLKQLAN